ncbi:hypothetical protein BXZ70DRAFT_695099 [Cristinia sonorae]|uniref:CBF1-interacting co-repressor CIR N-terminal domain-containing protein n=1 Tax=Cristinia sonorae TaxID=1940300 RepID=A0A8K0UDC4_9AGAR|nr:hypothetical protein BXZ70DRAFT_695099 [Cristinia sonorae]
MGKLNIAHHKSYHPYRRDNIERVRRDEEEARAKEAVEEGRMMLADSEARIDLLRQRAGLGAAKKHKQKEDDDVPPNPVAGPSTLTTSHGHINFFADLEKDSLPITIRTTQKGKAAEETEKGVPLAPSEKDRKPWYSDKDLEGNRRLDDDRKKRDLSRKSAHDPLTSINTQLSARFAGSTNDGSHNSRRQRGYPQNRAPSSASGQLSRPPEVSERLSRESSERQRALALIARKKREMAGSETPITVHGGMDGGYGDQFNRKEVEEAHRYRERRWQWSDREMRSKR